MIPAVTPSPSVALLYNEITVQTVQLDMHSRLSKLLARPLGRSGRKVSYNILPREYMPLSTTKEDCSFEATVLQSQFVYLDIPLTTKDAADCECLQNRPVLFCLELRTGHLLSAHEAEHLVISHQAFHLYNFTCHPAGKPLSSLPKILLTTLLPSNRVLEKGPHEKSLGDCFHWTRSKQS